MEEIKTDVLVIGGGLAGLIAALEARRKGLDVTIISKSKVGRSGNTLVANANISVLTDEKQRQDEYEKFYRDIIKSGKGINDEQLVDKFLRGCYEIVDILETYGVKLKKADDIIKKVIVPGHSQARTIYADSSNINYHNRGLAITLPILQKVKEWGIKIIEDSPVVKILVAQGQACGALAINKKEGKTIIFHVANIILAGGGGGNLFSKTNNTRDITGDSYGLALEAGVELKDMEFVQFYPTMMYSPLKLAMANTLFGDGAVLRNSEGKDFMLEYDKAGNMATRDIMSRAIFTEILAGRDIGGGVYLDCTTIPENILANRYKKYLEYIKKAGIDLSKEYVIISPAIHFLMGGIVINKKCQTNLPGLLACGEAVGGLHGANRLGGNALAEAIVFGVEAGRNTRTVNKIPELPVFELQEYQQGSISCDELKGQIKKTMWSNGSIIRSGELLEKVKIKLSTIENDIEQVRINNINDLASFYELKSMLNISKTIIEGAILRKESRGSHYRMDFPSQDNTKFRGNFIFKKNNDHLEVTYNSINSCYQD